MYFLTKLIAKRDSAIFTKFLAFFVQKWLFLVQKWQSTFSFLQFSGRTERKSRKILMGVNSGDFSSTFSENLKRFGQDRKKLIFWCLGVAGDVNFEYASLAPNDELENNIR